LLGVSLVLWQPIALQEEGKVLAVLVAPQMQQVAVLDFAPHRHCVPWRTYRPRASVPQLFPVSLFSGFIAATLAFLR
jgi:hypothetical protein